MHTICSKDEKENTKIEGKEKKKEKGTATTIITIKKASRPYSNNQKSAKKSWSTR
jgi:hypothetical protein